MRKTNKKKSARKDSPSLVKTCSAVVVVAVLFFAVFAGVDYLNKRGGSSTQENLADINTASLDNKSNQAANTTIDGKSDDETKTTHGSVEKELAAAAEEANNNFEKSDDGKKVAHLIVDYAYVEGGKVYASGETTDVVSTVGQCTYVFTQGDKVVSESVNVLPSAKNTVCEMLVLDKSKFSAGEWNVILKFNSEYAEGESEAISFTI